MVSFALLAAALWMGGERGFAAGPRWVTGPPFFNTSGQPVVWYTDTPLYFTDPGSLSATVSHAAADALVAAAAAVWNVPTARLVLGQGGSLDEHVSASNAYVGSEGIVFPADLLPANYAAKQIAVIYDRDGSVTDLLLGSGASDPSGCRQNAVTESVDSIVASGQIRHAVLVLNGRCTGGDPAMQMQMQYQLMRAFGRVLGLGWSQTNDNVFTGSPAPTYQQAMHWPVMHPIDIICGPYTYQCMPEPFTLRVDDISALAMLYFIKQGEAGPGKIDTLLDANRIGGRVTFPTGQGMQGVNMLARRLAQYTLDTNVEKWDSVSSVSGTRFRRSTSNAVMGVDTSIEGSMGSENAGYEGWYEFSRVPMLRGGWQWIMVETEAVNPLYTGIYSVGPYTANTVVPSGAQTKYKAGIMGSYADYGWFDVGISTAAPTCSGRSGAEAAPLNPVLSGWWAGMLCGYGQTAWSGLTVKANRSLTIEVTAQDEDGFASTAKAMPVIGVWRATDAVGLSPTVAAARGAFNGTSAGMTSLPLSGVAGDLRVAIADRRGDGRPDFRYGARVLYAETVSPGTVGAGGGMVTISGRGFRAGNVVTLNGVAATVQSWTQTSIVATVPSSRLLGDGARAALVADVTVRDRSTGGKTVMTGALSYAAGLLETMTVMSAPAGNVTVGTVAGTGFAVRVMDADGVTPVVGEPVAFSAGGVAAVLGACGAASCTVVTNASGVASMTVIPMAVGVVLLTATGDTTQASASFTGVAPVRTATVVRAVEYIAAGTTVVWSPGILLTDNSASTAGAAVAWNVSAGAMILGAGYSLANGDGVASITARIGPLTAGARANGTGCAWTVCGGFAAEGVGPEALQVDVVSGIAQSVAVSDTLLTVVLRVTDGLGHPVAGAAALAYQTLEEGVACPEQGRCPVEPVLDHQQTAAVSDLDGLVRVVPLQQVGGAGVTNIVATTGTQGFVSLSLRKGQAQ